MTSPRTAGILGLAMALLAGTAPAYQVVTRRMDVLQADRVSFTASAARIATAEGTRMLGFGEIDFYETFRRNVGEQGGNVVVFRTGALLPYEAATPADGSITFKVAGGGEVVVAEGLIDFQRTVVEGAMTRVPANTATIGVSRTPDGGGPSSSAASAAPARGSAGPTRSRRQPRSIGTAGPRTEAEAGAYEDAPPEEEVVPEDEPLVEEPEPVDETPEPEEPPPGEEPLPGETWQVQATVSTDYGSPVSGIQATVLYPARCQVVSPVANPAYTGFAAGMTTAVNTGRGGSPASPFRVGGYAPTGSPVSGAGEFLVITFQCSGETQDTGGFSLLSATATNDVGNVLTDFRATLSVN